MESTLAEAVFKSPEVR